MEKEEQLLRRRLEELAGTSYQRDIPLYSDFLNLNEQTIFLSMMSSLPVACRLEGGYDLAERKIVCFLPVREQEFAKPPICVIKIAPTAPKFARPCTHRDYLGAILNLGIDRGKTGDLLLDGNVCYCFCLPSVTGLILEQLVNVGHNPVTCQLADDIENIPGPSFEEVTGSVASERLDAILALAYRLSRGKVGECIQSERVFVNGRCVTANSHSLREGDVVSVRGLGKFIYKGAGSLSKKGRMFVTILKYQ